MKIIKTLVDILMYCDFLYLMNLGTTHQLLNHGVFGIGLFMLFILHHLLNLWFYKTAFSGKWNAKRIFLNITDWILFIFMILMAVSSVFMSGLIFEWASVQTTQSDRVLHLLSCSWGFIIMCIHLGLHTNRPLKKMEAKCSKGQKILLNIICILLSGAGIFCFIKTQLYVFMFNTGGWKVAAPNLIIGLLEYIGITLGICAFIKLFSPAPATKR